MSSDKRYRNAWGEPPRAPAIRVTESALGGWPWDRWAERARAAGVGAELAELGRQVMREAYQHAWSAARQTECGWDDDGAAMIEQARAAPSARRARWQWLLDTDGDE